jgi:hypothetical protein
VPGQLCYLCARAPAITEDHVPARGIFPSGYPNRGHPLPACLPCNRKFSKAENYVQRVFSMLSETPEAERVFAATVRDFARPSSPLAPKSKLDELKRRIRRVELTTPSGIYLGKGNTFAIDELQIQLVALKIVAGLHYRHFGSSLPSDYGVTIRFPPPNALKDYLKQPATFSGNLGEVLQYRCKVVNEDLSAIWWLTFYTTIWFPVLVESPSQMADRYSEGGVLLLL